MNPMALLARAECARMVRDDVRAPWGKRRDEIVNLYRAGHRPVLIAARLGIDARNVNLTLTRERRKGTLWPVQ